jgi:hypothetical protein
MNLVLFLFGLLVFINLTIKHGKAHKPRGRLTIPDSECPCWWDLEGVLIDPATDEPFKCTCCQPGGRQCGYPLHRWCTDDLFDGGCEGTIFKKKHLIVGQGKERR